VSRLLTLDTARANGARYAATEDHAWENSVCPHCSATQLLVVAYTGTDQAGASRPTAAPEGPRWYLCSACRRGSVLVEGRMQPSSRPLRTPIGLPEEDSAIWEEARSSLGVGAYTGTVMLCRKLLFHTAVKHGLPAKRRNGHAPGYMEAVKHLQDSGIITSVMRSWVDKIKEVGNDANHELVPITEQQATDVATFTEQLLRLAYEMEALMANPALEAEHTEEEPSEVSGE
jgi:hypothetical protein